MRHADSSSFRRVLISACTEGRLRLSRSGRLVPIRGGLPVQRRSPTQALTGPSVEYVHLSHSIVVIVLRPANCTQDHVVFTTRQHFFASKFYVAVLTGSWSIGGRWVSCHCYLADEILFLLACEFVCKRVTFVCWEVTAVIMSLSELISYSSGSIKVLAKQGQNPGHTYLLTYLLT